VTTSVDAANRVTSVSGVKPGEATKTYAASFTYTPHGAVASMQLGNNLWEHATFNSRLQPVQIGLGTSAADASTLRLNYNYGTTTNNNGNVVAQTITIPGGPTLTQSYAYDSLNRVQSATENGSASWQQRFIYDRYGNRNFDVAQTTIPLPLVNPTINPATNRISAGQGYTYDAAGNVTGEPSGSTYAYDAENRQVSYNGGQATYGYDGDGRRVKKVAGSVTTLFIYNVQGQMVAEYAMNAPPSSTSGGTSYLTADTLGSPRVVTDAVGNVKARHDYLPFGEELQAGVGGRTTAQGYSQPDGVRQGFTGYEKDGETGLNFARARYYSSPMGRFTSTDPIYFEPWKIRDPQGWNLYSYVRNNPLKYIDPLGLWKEIGCSSGRGTCYEAEEGDRDFSGLANLTGYSIDQLGNFFSGSGIEVGGVFDVSGLGLDNRAITTYNPDEFLVSNRGFVTRRSMFWGIGPETTVGTGTVFQGGSRAGGGLLSRLWSRLIGGSRGATFAGGVTLEAMEAAAADSGSTIAVVTKLAQAPRVGQQLYAWEEGSASIANQAIQHGQVYSARIPKALIETLRTAGLVEDQIILMNGVQHKALYFRPEASEFVVRFFQ